MGENDGYDTAQNIAIRNDIGSQNALPYVMVNSPRLMQHSHWRTRSHACKRHQRSLTTFELFTLSALSNTFDDVQCVWTWGRSHSTARFQFERQWEVHLRLHSSRPSQWICGRRPGTACIWVWLHTGWTTTLLRPTTNAWQSRLAPGNHTADFIWRNSATVIWKGLGLN